MLSFFANNLQTIIVGAIVLAAVGLAVVVMVRDRLNHRSSCGSGCGNCPSSRICHKG